MNRFVNFLMVGLAFTVLQVSTVSAQAPGAPGTMAPPMGDPNMPPPMMAPGTMPPPTGAPAVTGKRRGGKMGNYGCGNKNKRKHVNCLRDLLDTTPLSDKVKHAKKGKKRGFYGCGNKNKRKHTSCLRRLLDQHGPHLAKGGKRGMAPGTN